MKTAGEEEKEKTREGVVSRPSTGSSTINYSVVSKWVPKQPKAGVGLSAVHIKRSIIRNLLRDLLPVNRLNF